MWASCEPAELMCSELISWPAFFVFQDNEEHSYSTLKSRNTSARVSGLKPGTKYIFQVRARTSAGCGRFSQNVEIQTGKAGSWTAQRNAKMVLKLLSWCLTQQKRSRGNRKELAQLLEAGPTAQRGPRLKRLGCQQVRRLLRTSCQQNCSLARLRRLCEPVHLQQVQHWKLAAARKPVLEYFSFLIGVCQVPGLQPPAWLESQSWSTADSLPSSRRSSSW